MPESALVGQPPLNSDDYYIVRALLREAGLFNLDPKNGAMLPPARPPNYHYHTRGPGIIAGMSLVIAFVVLITGARLMLRSFRRELKWGWDDWVIIPSAMGVIAYMAIQIAMVMYGGAGKHMYDCTYHDVYVFYRLGFIEQLIFYVTVGLIKISINLFNRRLTGLTSKNWMILHNIFFGVVTAYIILALFWNLFECTPYASTYSLIYSGKLTEPPKCTNVNTIGITLSTLHIALDFCLLTVPLIVLYRVKMSFWKKARLMFVFCIGTVSCVASVLRGVAQEHLSIDGTYEYTTLLAWIAVDMFTGVAVASLPVLNAALPRSWNASPLSSRIMSKLSTSKLGSKLSSNHNTKGSMNLDSQPESQTSDHTGIHRQDEVELKFYSVDAVDDEERGHHAQVAPWEDDAALVQRPMPAYADPMAVRPNQGFASRTPPPRQHRLSPKSVSLFPK
ncbi:MAG: hypothetical protein M1827_001923 [Pycnora praestabilis]|nr:MAG: hypothetical protein M1827_001923 [Pycnora praestabilis]